MNTAAPVTIIVHPIGCGRFEAALADGALLVASTRQLLLDAARVLISVGIDPTTTIVMRDAGSDTEALSATIGAAAALTVEEDHGCPRFRRWRGEQASVAAPPIRFQTPPPVGHRADLARAIETPLSL